MTGTGTINSIGTVADISDAELLARAVRSAREAGARRPHPRVLAAMSAFALGSTYAAQLCRRFGLNPDEMVKP